MGLSERDAAPNGAARAELAPYAIALGLLIEWQQLFHQLSAQFFPSVSSQAVTMLIPSGCIVFFLGVSAGAALFIGVERLGGPLLGAIERATLSSFSMLAIGLVLSAAFSAGVALRAPSLLQVVQFAAILYGTFLLMHALGPMLSRSASEAAAALGGAMMLQAVVGYVFVPFLHAVGGIYAAIVLQAAIWAAFVVLRHRSQKSGSEGAPSWGCFAQEAYGDSGSGARGKAFSLPAPFVFHLVAFYAVFGVMHASVGEVADSTMAIAMPRFLAFAAVAALAFFLSRHSRELSFPWSLARTAIFPLALLAFLTLPLTTSGFEFDGSHVYYVPLFFIQSSVAVYDVFGILMVCYIAKEGRVSASAVVARTFLVKGVASIAGVVAGAAVINLSSFGDLRTVTMVNILAAVVLMAGVFWIGDDKRVRKIWGMRVEKTARQLHDEMLEAKVAALSEAHQITTRERDVMALLLRGERPKRISEKLFVSPNTINSHIKSIYRKLDVHSVSELAKLVDETPVSDG